MANEMKRVPELRFSQFDKEWEKTTIADIGEFYYGRSAPKWSITDDATIPCVRYGELYTKHKGTVKEIYSYTNIERNKLRFSKGGEILIPRVGEDPMDFAKCSYLPFSGVAIGEMISVYNTDQNPVFITAYFNSQMKYEFAKRVEGASVSNLYYSYLKDINLRIPTIEEQQKIGDFFSKLDRQIELEEQKLEKLEEQKKGYMQKIFSQELRFKDESGKDYPEWEIKKLGELYKIVMGQSPKSINYTDDNSYPVLVQGNADIYNGNIFPRIYTKEITKLVKKGDILLTVRAPVGEIGIAQFEACMGRGVCSIEGDKFIYYFLEMFGIQNKWQKLSQGSTFESISGNEVRNIEMPIPSPREREKVSDFFSELDHIINMHSQKIDNMKLRKQGLLQKMFI